MTLSVTIDVWNTLYAVTLVYSVIALFLIYSGDSNWGSGSPKTRGDFLISAIFAMIPFVNVIVMTVQLVITGKYKWLADWFEAPLKPGTQDVTDPEPGVESSPIIQLETNDGTETRS